MKKIIFRISAVFLILIFGLTLSVGLLIKTGKLYLGISAYAHYRLNETETKLFENWIARFHKNVENGDFEEIRKELIKTNQGLEIQNSELKNAKFAFDKYGKIDYTKFFRSMPPEPSSRSYGGSMEGRVYGLMYHSNAERGRLSESFELVINDNNEVGLFRYRGDEMKEWEVISDNNEFWLEHNLPNEMRIPFGERFIEIRY